MIYLHFIIDYVFQKNKPKGERNVQPYFILYPYTAGNKEQQKEKEKIKKILEEEKICDINSLRNLLSCRGYIPYMVNEESDVYSPDIVFTDQLDRKEYGFYKILKK